MRAVDGGPQGFSATPTVSIVTPVYNAARHIAATIDSVIAQTRTDWELVIVDDSSADESVAIVQQFAERDHRIRIIQQSGNSGPAAARQRGLDAATARYVALLDSDDLWLPEKLAEQLAFMAETGAPLTFTAYRRISEDGSRTGRMISVPPSLTYRGLLKNTAIATSTAMVDRAQTGPLAMTFCRFDDYALWLELLGRGHVALGLPRDLMRYRVVRRSVSRNKGRAARWVWSIYRDVRRLSRVEAAWCFAHYAAHALAKHGRF